MVLSGAVIPLEKEDFSKTFDIRWRQRCFSLQIVIDFLRDPAPLNYNIPGIAPSGFPT